MYGCAWVHIDVTLASGRVLSLQHSGADDAGIRVSDKGKVRFFVDEGTRYESEANVPTGEWVFLEMLFDGSDVYGRVNGVESTKVTASFDFSTASGATSLGSVAGSSTNPFLGEMCGACIGQSSYNLSISYPLAELSGPTCYDTSGNGNDGTITSVSGIVNQRAARQDVYHRNFDNGCTLYEHATLDNLLVPYLDSGIPYPSPTVPAGYTKTEDIPAGKHLGNIETGVIWDGAAQDVAEAIANPFWGNGVSLLTKYYSDFLNHVNYENNVLCERITISTGAKVINYVITYLSTKMFTPVEYQKNASFLKNDEGDSLVPAEVTAGTGIGPNGAWADNGDGHILFVEDA